MNCKITIFIGQFFIYNGNMLIDGHNNVISMDILKKEEEMIL